MIFSETKRYPIYIFKRKPKGFPFGPPLFGTKNTAFHETPFARRQAWTWATRRRRQAAAIPRGLNSFSRLDAGSEDRKRGEAVKAFFFLFGKGEGWTFFFGRGRGRVFRWFGSWMKFGFSSVGGILSLGSSILDICHCFYFLLLCFVCLERHPMVWRIWMVLEILEHISRGFADLVRMSWVWMVFGWFMVVELFQIWS